MFHISSVMVRKIGYRHFLCCGLIGFWVVVFFGCCFGSLVSFCCYYCCCFVFIFIWFGFYIVGDGVQSFEHANQVLCH